MRDEKGSAGSDTSKSEGIRATSSPRKERTIKSELLSPGTAAPSATSQLLTVQRAVAILDYLHTHPSIVSLRQIATALKQSQSAIFRLVSTLESSGLVQRYESPRGYGLGWKIDILANSHRRQLSNIGPIREAVDALGLESGQTAAAHMVSGMFSVCIATRESDGALVYRIPVGRTASLALGAGGKAILAFSDLDSETVLRVAEGGLKGPKATKSLEELADELKEIKRTGVAVSSEELVQGVSSVAMPIFAGPSASVLGSLSLSGPTFQWDLNAMRKHISLLRKFSVEVSKTFDCHAPPTASLEGEQALSFA